MDARSLYEAWSPADVVWSRWSKPSLFAGMSPGMRAADSPIDFAQTVRGVETGYAPDPSRRLAIVLDLPGREAVLHGLALALRGYRPIPLFNTCTGPSAVIDVTTLMLYLVEGAGELSRIRIPMDAPPLFLLDHQRCPPKSSPPPGSYDNRWIVFPQDFPSARFMKEQAIRGAVHVSPAGGEPQDDLLHVLRRWQDAKLELHATGPGSGGTLRSLTVSKPSWFRLAFYSFLVMFGMRRNSTGGFGWPVPQQSSGGGGFS